ncbi:hypothetical protein BH20ACT2_BH20ACT2_09620 [soil metagenome]
MVRPPATTPAHLDPGTKIEVWCQFTQGWSPGFDVSEEAADGYRVRRRSDGAVLPTAFTPESVRAEDR